MVNPLDQCNISIRSVANSGTNTCTVRSPGYPSCSDLLDICFCEPNITDPPTGSKCVNTITSLPWMTPPPIDAGCNPFSMSITNRQDETANSNISLKGKINYLGNDPCLPQLDLELVTSPTFFRGGGSPNVKGWGISYYGGIFTVCPESCCDYENPQEFFAEVHGAETFIPEDINCSSILDQCRFKRIYAQQAPNFNLLGPILAEITENTVLNTYDGEPYAWRYRFSVANCVIAGNMCMSCSAALPYSNAENLPGAENNVCYNIKENLDYLTYKLLTPGVDLDTAKELGLKPQPLAAGTQVLLYGWVPWARPGAQGQVGNCNCEIVWFVDVPNALAGECEDAEAQQLEATSMMPARTINFAGEYYGSPNNENRV